MVQNGRAQTGRNGNAAPLNIVEQFRATVIERFQIVVDGRSFNYQTYLALPTARRSGDEADAVDQRFARAVIAWLGFVEADWNYNQPQAGQKSVHRPDYIVHGGVAVAFIWEDKNSTLDLERKHLEQMHHYCLGTAGYAVWCNMRRILALRFITGETLNYEILADVNIEQLFGAAPSDPAQLAAQATQLALFQLLFSKERFTRLTDLLERISVAEEVFLQQARTFDDPQTTQHFINGSRGLLDHLRLAALARVQEAIAIRERVVREEADLRQEWQRARDEFISKIQFGNSRLDVISRAMSEAIDQLTPRLGDMEPLAIKRVEEVFKRVGTVGVGRLTASLRTNFEAWLTRALRINNALLTMRFESLEPVRIADAYQIWSERQSDKEDVLPEVFAEQVAYVFFVRLLLVRVLEDKGILRPRLASNGGFLDWSGYVRRHFAELDGIGIISDTYSHILTLKASHYYMHFFHQAVFDWFAPDDFLMVEALEFLCRYNFQHITSDIIGFTYEEYIDRNARNRKGHFLTRQDVVDYMLDTLEYNGPQIIGRRIFDPACGSGSFLVHAARRYRAALVTYFCNLHGLMTEEQLVANAALRREMAQRYLDDLTGLFFGMELNPFACYLAEMNLLVQSLDDLIVLRDAGINYAIERFRIYNADSLDLPREVLDSDVQATIAQAALVPDRLSDRLVDEAHPIKAKLDEYADGFFYIISNPPYVSSKQEEMNVNRYRNAEFYRAMLSGDTNLYLLFLRLGMYYLADYGRMIFIMPLTIFGDRSASAARRLLKTPPFSPDAVVRFYRGDILFPGVDQAVGILRVSRSQPTNEIMVSGGLTIAEARASQFRTALGNVIDAVPENGMWHGNWLVTNRQIDLDVWQYVRSISDNLNARLASILDEVFERKQGDVNATLVNPLRVENGSTASGCVALYKGEDIHSFAPLPAVPSDWARPLSNESSEGVSSDVLRTSQVLEQIKRMSDKEVGIALREVARLNTRERLTATWFERDSRFPLAFTHKLWRMILKTEASAEVGKALLALITSKTISYLVNLFSTNNDVLRDDLSRIPIPAEQSLPVAQLAALADQLLSVRTQLETAFVTKYHAELPGFPDGTVYLPPSAVLAQVRLPKLTLQSLVGRGEVRNEGALNGRIRTLCARDQIVCTIPSTHPNAQAFARVLALFLSEPEREQETWEQALQWQLPDPIAAAVWLTQYEQLSQQAQQHWNDFVALQQQADNAVADWYGFTAEMRAAIIEGLPWARRQR